jgi:hypothetical protein
MIESDCWTTSSLWKLVRAISEEISRDSDLENNRASEWVAVNSYPRRNTASNHWDSPPRPPATGIGEIDHMVRRVFAVVSAVARACAPFGNYEKLVAESTERQRRQLGSRANAGLDNPIPIVEWDLLSLRYLESDYFLAALTRVVWNWVEKLQHIPANNRLAVAQPVLSRLENLFGSIKTKVVPGEIELEKLLSFLSLPIWKQRPALYSAWMLPVIEQALAEYPIQIYSDNGTLRFGFTATPMATFKSSEGEITLVAESRFPLKNPIGEGRTNNVQPDYVFFVGNTNKQPNAKLVLELKQYLRPSLKKFGDALTDYARAFTEAKVVLADYGPISPALIDMLPVNLSNRAVAVGDVRPGGVSEILHLQQHIRATLPPPQVAKHMAPSAVSTIIVDVSGSMRETLTWQLVRKHLHDLEASNPSAAWVAADTGVRATLSGPNAVDQLLALDMSGSTSLAQIASSYQGSTTIVITDEDGEKQLRDEELQLKRIGLARPNGIEWQSTAN